MPSRQYKSIGYTNKKLNDEPLMRKNKLPRQAKKMLTAYQKKKNPGFPD
jgi:hypothetical protein